MTGFDSRLTRSSESRTDLEKSRNGKRQIVTDTMMALPMFSLDDYEVVIPRLGVALVVLWLTWKTLSFFKPRNQHTLRSVAIVVLGDIGRSPRMMYHAESFAENGFFTELIGYGGTKLTRLQADNQTLSRI